MEGQRGQEKLISRNAQLVYLYVRIAYVCDIVLGLPGIFVPGYPDFGYNKPLRDPSHYVAHNGTNF